MALVTSGSTDMTFTAAGAGGSVNIDAGTSSNRILVGSVCFDGSAGHTDVTATFNAVNVTFEAAVEVNGNERKRTFHIVGIPTGTSALAVAPTGVGVGDAPAIVDYAVYDTIDQTTPVDGFTNAQGTDSSSPYESAVTVTSEVGDTVWTSHSGRGSGWTAAAPTGYTERTENFNGTGSATQNSASGDAAGAASVATTTAWTGSGFAITWIAHGLNLNAAAGGATQPPRSMHQFRQRAA